MRMEMKKESVSKLLATGILSLFFLCGCERALDPLLNGHYTDENLYEYPTLIKGFVDKAYSLLSKTYYTNEYVFLDCATDNGVATASNQVMRKFAGGSLSPSEDPFATFWSRDYDGIYYVNQFLKDDIGLNTQYRLDPVTDRLLRRSYQGDALALRAWFTYDLLSKFGGRDAEGTLLGVPLLTVDFDPSQADASEIRRADFDACVRSILTDCDAALEYLPYANRDALTENTTVEGSVRWQRFDQVSVLALKALTYLLWASDAFNPGGDMTRWEKAAEYAWQAIDYKLKVDATMGFNPASAFQWTDPNSPELYWASLYKSSTSEMETAQYPYGFRGTCKYAPSQELVDAFPMANGYPIDDPRSLYDPSKPYEGRDPRFYSTIFYHGATVRRNGTGEVMYTFDTSTQGADRSGLTNNGLTNYYLKKYVYLGWNGNDRIIQTLPRCVFFLRWADLCLVYAEAANRAWGPADAHLGLSAKDVLAYLRKRTTSDGTPGLGVTQDPYLEECAASKEQFETLVRNERRIETCFEGKRLPDLIRWDTPLQERNKDVHRAEITRQPDGSYSYDRAVADSRKFSSKWIPLPYGEVVKMSQMHQNAGWENWQNNQ